MKHFMKALHKDGVYFQYISDAFPGLSEEKKISDGPQIRQLIQDKNFTQSLAPVKRDAWLSFMSVTKNFLSNTKADNCVHLVNDMLGKFKKLNIHVSIKIPFVFPI